MTESVAKLTIATSEGAVWLALVLHFAAGLVGLVSGFFALAVAKGGSWHRQAGIVFVVSMISNGVLASGLAAYEGNLGMVVGGAMTAYFVLTAFTTVRPFAEDYRDGASVALVGVGVLLALSMLASGIMALGSPKVGVPTPMILFLAAVALLAAIGDVRLIRAGGIRGARRVARHLWRMCFGLFIASGSFFLGQMKFLPSQLRILPLLLALAVAPLVFLLYWMWRVRLRQRLQDLELRRPIEAGNSG